MKIEKLARSDFKRLASQLAGFVLENNRASVIFFRFSSDAFVGFAMRAEGPRGGVPYVQRTKRSRPDRPIAMSGTSFIESNIRGARVATGRRAKQNRFVSH